MISDIKAYDDEKGLTLKRLQKAKNYIIGYKLGKQDYFDGVKLRECPYPQGDPYRKGWRKGWKYENTLRKDAAKQEISLNQPSQRNVFQKELLHIYKGKK